jgi:hypothetical protein
MMGSTPNALAKGGSNFKKLYEDSNIKTRNENGQTKSGMYSLYIPMEWNFEGYIDRYGMPVFRKPETPVTGIDGRLITNGAIDYWENEVASLKNDADALNEYNDSLIRDQILTRGSFHWKNGEKDTQVIWTPDPRGRFLVSWIPNSAMQNQVVYKNGNKYPGNEHIGAFGCDPYDISGTVGGGGSNGSLHGLTKFNMDNAPSNHFFLEYIARPQTAEIFFEEVLMACIFYGMPILVENNKPRLLYHFKNRGYRGFSMNRPDKHFTNLSKTERELGGIPNSSEDVKQSHAAAIQSYIEKYVGMDTEGTYRDSDEMGDMYFTRTIEEWAKFDINNRTKFDAAISSGLAIMANQKNIYLAAKKESKISVNFAKYNNSGTRSELIR